MSVSEYQTLILLATEYLNTLTFHGASLEVKPNALLGEK